MKTIYQITENVYWMPFPKQNQIQEVSSYLNKQFGHHYYIWNLSEHDYQRDFFQNQVSMHSYQGFACPPLYELLLICKCILEWVQQDGNVAIVHCQQNKGRSAMLLSIFWTLAFNSTIAESYYIITKALNVTQPLRSQLVYMNRYITRLFQDQQLNTELIKVKSVILSHIPKEFKLFRPYFQILNRTGILYEEKNQIIGQNQQCIFILPNLPITQDIVFRCKHITADGELIPIFRFQVHTGFLFKNIIRFRANDLDLSSPVDDDFYIDMVYLRGNENYNISDMQKEQNDYQSQEGCKLIVKLLDACSNLSNLVKYQLYLENTISTEYLEICQIQQQNDNQQQIIEHEIKNEKEEENQQLKQIDSVRTQSIEMINYPANSDFHHQQQNDEDDDDDIII